MKCSQCSGASGVGSAALALLVPKCPLCLAGWASVLSAVGLDLDRWDRFEWPLTIGFMVVAVALLGARVGAPGRTLIVVVSTLLLAAKMVAESQFSGLMLAGWVCLAIPVSAVFPAVSKSAAAT